MPGISSTLHELSCQSSMDMHAADSGIRKSRFSPVRASSTALRTARTVIVAKMRSPMSSLMRKVRTMSTKSTAQDTAISALSKPIPVIIPNGLNSAPVTRHASHVRASPHARAATAVPRTDRQRTPSPRRFLRLRTTRSRNTSSTAAFRTRYPVRENSISPSRGMVKNTLPSPPPRRKSRSAYSSPHR